MALTYNVDDWVKEASPGTKIGQVIKALETPGGQERYLVGWDDGSVTMTKDHATDLIVCPPGEIPAAITKSTCAHAECVQQIPSNKVSYDCGRADCPNK
jgi:hypothetical protein